MTDPPTWKTEGPPKLLEGKVDLDWDPDDEPVYKKLYSEEHVSKLRALAAELLDAYIDACHQGSGNEPLSSPTWHNFISTWEEADELIPRAREILEAHHE